MGDTSSPVLPCPVRISLVIPAYNEEKYIVPTLESVTAAKGKFERATGERVEVIVVDNASTDRTAELARGYGCEVVGFERHQIAAVRNAGARAARGEYIAFVDADRSIVPEDLFLEIAGNLGDANVYGGGSGFRPEAWNIRIWLLVMFFRATSWLLGVGCVLYYMRRSDFEALGGWNERMYAAEDVELSFRMKRAARRSGRRLRHLRGKTSVCVRKIHMLPPLRTLWRSLRALIRWDFSNPDDFHSIFYDVDKLR